MFSELFIQKVFSCATQLFLSEDFLFMKILFSEFLLLICIVSFGQTRDYHLKVTHLTGNFYVYESFGTYKGQKIGANAMYLVTNKGVVLFDTPWDTAQFQNLLDTIYARHHKKVVMCVATHFHEDRSGGLEYYRSKGIKTYTTRMTDSLSRLKGEKRAEFLMDHDTTFHIGQFSFRVIYPGGGHTIDNIIVWFEKEKILYGGCLIKSADASNLGNLADADIHDYAKTIRNIQSLCRNPKYIITGHDDWRNKHSLQHTLELAEKLKD